MRPGGTWAQFKVHLHLEALLNFGPWWLSDLTVVLAWSVCFSAFGSRNDPDGCVQLVTKAGSLVRESRADQCLQLGPRPPETTRRTGLVTPGHSAGLGPFSELSQPAGPPHFHPFSRSRPASLPSPFPDSWQDPAGLVGPTLGDVAVDPEC